jgi:hypothetical protein
LGARGTADTAVELEKLFTQDLSNLEIQWRLATLKEAKAVVTQYHKYLSENSLIKIVVDETVPSTQPHSIS